MINHGDIYIDNSNIEYHIFRSDLLDENVGRTEPQKIYSDSLWLIGGLNNRRDWLYSDTPRSTQEMIKFIGVVGWKILESKDNNFILQGAL